MGIGGKILEKPRYPIEIVVDVERFSDRIVIVEILFRDFLSHDDRIRLHQNRGSVAFEEFPAKYIKHLWVRMEYLGLLIYSVLSTENDHFAVVSDPCGNLYFGDFGI